MNLKTKLPVVIEDDIGDTFDVIELGYFLHAENLAQSHASPIAANFEPCVRPILHRHAVAVTGHVGQSQSWCTAHIIVMATRSQLSVSPNR